MCVIISGYLETTRNPKDVQNARHHTGMKEKRKRNEFRSALNNSKSLFSYGIG